MTELFDETILLASEFQDLSLDLSEREIYNDIRANCDITEILTLRPDATPEFFDKYHASEIVRGIPPYTTQYVTLYPAEGRFKVVWQDISNLGGRPMELGWSEDDCLALGGRYYPPIGDTSRSVCYLPATLAEYSVTIYQRAETYCTVRITNDCAFSINVWFDVDYLALSSDKRYQKQRAVNEASIPKYGRRTMDLDWPLGMHPTTMQQIIDNYCARHCEPISVIGLTVKGKDDERIAKILALAMDDRVRIVHELLGINEQFFVTNIAISHDVNGLLEGSYQLEQVRDSERLLLFTLDLSLLDGEEVLAP